MGAVVIVGALGRLFDRLLQEAKSELIWLCLLGRDRLALARNSLNKADGEQGMFVTEENE